MILLTVEWNAFPFLFAERRLRRLDFLLLLNHCNECRPTCVVVLMVMLTGYLPEMRNKHFIKLIKMIGIVDFLSEFLVKLPN